MTEADKKKSLRRLKGLLELQRQAALETMTALQTERQECEQTLMSLDAADADNDLLTRAFSDRWIGFRSKTLARVSALRSRTQAASRDAARLKSAAQGIDEKISRIESSQASSVAERELGEFVALSSFSKRSALDKQG